MARKRTFEIVMKSREWLEENCPHWWFNWCGDKHLIVQEATQEDLARCMLLEDSSRDPKDYFVEARCAQGALILRKAVARIVEFKWSSEPGRSDDLLREAFHALDPQQLGENQSLRRDIARHLSINPEHTLFERRDPDVPEQILDRNGDIALDLCRVCGKGEVELERPCDGELRVPAKPLEPDEAVDVFVHYGGLRFACRVNRQQLVQAVEPGGILTAAFDRIVKQINCGER